MNMVKLSLLGDCSVCGKKLKSGERITITGKTIGVSGLLTGSFGGIDLKTAKVYCEACDKKR